jgi:wyosine [tRNA(Phe)-imidazoG37] synthetase (radical SAM superfamily)
MLVKNLNDSVESLTKTANVVKKINPHKAYILVATRPPAENWVELPDESQINSAYQIFTEMNITTELLIHNEGTDFTYSSNSEKELMSILAVHPMRKDAIEKFLFKSGNGWTLIECLINNNRIKEVYYNHNSYFVNRN